MFWSKQFAPIFTLMVISRKLLIFFWITEKKTNNKNTWKWEYLRNTSRVDLFNWFCFLNVIQKGIIISCDLKCLPNMVQYYNILWRHIHYSDLLNGRAAIHSKPTLHQSEFPSFHYYLFKKSIFKYIFYKLWFRDTIINLVAVVI